MSTTFRVGRALGIVTMVSLFTSDIASAGEPEPMAEHQIKALYLYNFTKYVTWPAEVFTNANTPFTIGLMAGPDLQRDLLEITKGKDINGRQILVQKIDQVQDAKTCHLVFLESEDHQRLNQILNAARDLPVLTVGVSQEFLISGGIITFVRKENKLRLSIDLDAERRVGLTLSGKLLAVAENVKHQEAGTKD